jgi:hypothetical protein
MGVSLIMKVRTGHHVYADPQDITPGWRSQCALVLRERFGEAPHRLDREDAPLLEEWARGASVYTSDEKNVWKLIAQAIHNHGGVEIEAEY